MTLISHFADVLADSDVPDGSDSGAVSRYEFENDVTDSWGSNDGTDNTDVSPAYVSGVRGQAKNFDGTDDYVDLGSNNGITGTITVSQWVKIGTIPSSDIVHISSAGNDGTNTGWEWKMNGASGDLEFGSFDGSTAYKTTYALSNLTSSTWTLLTGTYDGSSWNIYKNGRSVSSSNISTGAINSTSKTFVGALDSDGGTKNYYDGKTDDLRIYDRALTPQEVNKLYKWGQATDYASNNHGQFNGPTETNGPFGNTAMSFDGADDIVHRGNTITHSGTITVSAWLKPDSSISNSKYAVNNYDGSDWYLLGVNGDDTFYMQVDDGSNNPNSGKSDTYVFDQWHHVVGVYNHEQSYLRIYVDGSQDNESSTSLSAPDYSTGTDYLSNSTRYYNGAMADVRIYKRALTPQEVQALYQVGKKSEVIFKE